MRPKGRRTPNCRHQAEGAGSGTYSFLSRFVVDTVLVVPQTVHRGIFKTFRREIEGSSSLISISMLTLRCGSRGLNCFVSSITTTSPIIAAMAG